MGRHSTNLLERTSPSIDRGPSLRERFSGVINGTKRAVGALALVGAVGTGLFASGAGEAIGNWHERTGSAEMGQENTDFVMRSSEIIADELHSIQTGMANDPEIFDLAAGATDAIYYEHDGGDSSGPAYEIFQANFEEEGGRKVLAAEYRERHDYTYSATTIRYDVSDLPSADTVPAALASLAEAPPMPPLEIAEYGGVLDEPLAHGGVLDGNNGGAEFGFVVVDGKLRVQTGAESPGWVSASRDSDNLKRMTGTVEHAVENLSASAYASAHS